MIEGDHKVKEKQEEFRNYLFKVIKDFYENKKEEPNAFYIADAMACSWWCYCGQLGDEAHNSLLTHFLSIACADGPPSAAFVDPDGVPQ